MVRNHHLHNNIYITQITYLAIFTFLLDIMESVNVTHIVSGSKKPSAIEESKVISRNIQESNATILASSKECRELTTVLMNLTDIYLILLDSLRYECWENDTIILSRPNIALRSARAETPAILMSYHSTIHITSSNVTIISVILLGGWNIIVGKGSSLTLQDVFIDHTAITVDSGATLTIKHATISRLVDSEAALEITAGSSSIQIIETLIRDEQAGRLVVISGDQNTILFSNVTVESILMQNFFSGTSFMVSVAGIYISGKRVLANISSSRVKWCGRGAIAFDGENGTLTVSNSELSKNYGSSRGGAAISMLGPGQSLFVSSCQIRGNEADFDGGAISFIGDDGLMNIRDSYLRANQALYGAGAVSFLGARGSVEVVRCFFSANIAFTTDGGALVVVSPEGFVAISESVIEDNICIHDGGGAAIGADVVNITGSSFLRNNGESGGGAHIRAQEATVSASTFTRNSARASAGGGLAFTTLDTAGGTATLIVSSSVFVGNFAVDGGAVSVLGACRASLTDIRVAANRAQHAGGGLILSDARADGRSNITGSSFLDNLAQSGPGGGVFVAGGDLHLDSTTVTGNRAGSDGGGIAFTGAPASPDGWRVAQSNVSRNSALGAGGGLMIGNTSVRVRQLAHGSGVPMGFGPRAGTVVCRGAGDVADRDLLVVDASGITAAEVLHRDADSVQAFGVAELTLALAASLDGSVVLVYLQHGFEVVALSTFDGAIIARTFAPRNPAYSPVNEFPLAGGDVLALLVPMVADMDFWYALTYGGWGLSSAEGSGRIFASTFHRTLEYDMAAQSFRELEGCSMGVSAMVFSSATGTLHLARYSGTGLSFELYFYSPLSAVCTPHVWTGKSPAFKQIRAVGVSEEGLHLYVAETVQMLDVVNEEQVSACYC
jgi:hypothetical protein